jgi:hypothetical protein
MLSQRLYFSALPFVFVGLAEASRKNIQMTEK